MGVSASSLSSAAPAAIRVPVAAADEKLLLQITLTLMSLPTGVRVYILNLLDPESLKELTLVSKQLHQECNGLGIENPIIPVFQLSPLSDNYCGLFGACMCVSKQNFLQNISHYRLDEETYRILQRYRQMEVKDFDKFGYVIGHALLRKVMNSTIQMQGIVLLNISLPKQRQQRLPLFYQPLTTCSLAIALSRIVPNLLELDLSNTPSSGTILQNFSVHCPLLEKITCNNNNNIYADGSEIQWATNLNEIVMDNCIVSYLKPIVTANNNDNDNNTNTVFLFHYWSSRNKVNLEKVSIRNAKYFGNYDQLLIPQTALVKYIRNAPVSLKWFRSSLSQKNINMLQKERPGIQFLN
mmetsp:Transcript_43788/g.49384  ORF Transcript_43788/g.49384 Transcript_43788/m.49384 type:complete len:353 (-) Transcript_43788:40-1098(-)